jgi:WD40 repeat protein
MVVRSLACIVLIALFGIMTVSSSVPDVIAQQGNSEVFDYTELTIPDLRRIAWRPDGQVLAIGAGNEVVLYTSALQEMLRLEGHTDIVNSVSWSADGTRLASGGNDDVIRIWNVDDTSRSYGIVQMVLQNANDVYTVSWNPDLAKSQLAAAVLDRVVWTSESGFVHVTVNIWDASTARIQYTLPELVNAAPYLIWNADGRELITSSISLAGLYSVHRWNPRMGEGWSLLPPYLYRINALDLEGDSGVLAVGSDYDPLLLVTVGAST